ncbi:MAG: hypothetical protein PHR82_05225 [Endomicrobiaceae bacterium]|nr:hypothetical protein [Endomicrobiaceae bacterium]
MIKKIAISLSFVIFFISVAVARSPIQVKSIVKGIDIIGPDKEKNRFFDVNTMPSILYSSSISAYGGIVNLSLYGVDIVLKNSQRIYISKDPISEGIRIIKIENSIDFPVLVDLPVLISIGELMTISLDYNAIISFKQKYDDVYEFSVVCGTVNVKKMNETKQLSAGEKFEYELVGGNEDAI